MRVLDGVLDTAGGLFCFYEFGAKRLVWEAFKTVHDVLEKPAYRKPFWVGYFWPEGSCLQVKEFWEVDHGGKRRCAVQLHFGVGRVGVAWHFGGGGL